MERRMAGDAWHGGHRREGQAARARRAGKKCGRLGPADPCGVCDGRDFALDWRTLTGLQRHRSSVLRDLQLRDEPQCDVQIVQQLHPIGGAARTAVDLELHVQRAADRLDAGRDEPEPVCGEIHRDGLPVRLGLSVVQVRDF